VFAFEFDLFCLCFFFFPYRWFSPQAKKSQHTVSSFFKQIFHAHSLSFNDLNWFCFNNVHDIYDNLSVEALANEKLNK